MGKQGTTRRDMLKRSSIILISVAAGSLECLPRTVFAGKAAKSDFHYQDHPNEGQRCADCTQFTPSSQAQDAAGTCRIVEGTVSADGWCMAFTKKP
jgi:hypothetical protein